MEKNKLALVIVAILVLVATFFAGAVTMRVLAWRRAPTMSYARGTMMMPGYNAGGYGVMMPRGMLPGYRAPGFGMIPGFSTRGSRFIQRAPLMPGVRMFPRAPWRR
ncbi:MAG: hypothetical protein HZC40_01035 [Chloroflexi bacterium]|nr:hypothetical protein [Chloroflexota bacterium]